MRLHTILAAWLTLALHAMAAPEKPNILFISIGKAALGFRQFSVRGLAPVRSEWILVTLAYNLKRLFHLGVRMQKA